MRLVSPSGSDWRLRLALLGRPPEAVPGLDDARSLRRIFLSAFALWGLGFFAFVGVVSRTETMIVLSTHTERTRIALETRGDAPRPRRAGGARGRRAK